jgi:integrase
LYGRHLYDFFSFLEANCLRWDQKQSPGKPSVVALYREWAVRRRQVGTVNDHLGTIERFYHWCQYRELIDELPWDLEEVRVRTRAGMLRHVSVRGASREVSDVKFREFEKPLELLNVDECVSLLDILKRNPTHYRMTHFALATGMRVDELISLPSSVAVNPASRDHRDKRTGKVVLTIMFTIKLDPTVMRTKNSKERVVYVSRATMQALYDYAMINRTAALRVAKVRGEDPHELFLTPKGRPYAEKSYNMVLRRAGKKIGRHVYPHMLRHTFATHTLHALRKSRNDGFALQWVRDRLGHASVETTMRYLHLLGELHLDTLDAYQRELDVAMELGEKAPSAA